VFTFKEIEMAIPYSMTNTSLSVVIGFVPKVIPRTHPNYDEICRLVVDPDTTEDELIDLIDIPTAISKKTGGFVSVIDGHLYYKGYEVKSALATLIMSHLSNGAENAAAPLIAFLEKAFENPDPRAAEGLFDWVNAAGLPITTEGNILAWKAVQSDYFSIHSGRNGRLRHMIGDVVEEPRHETDSNPDQTCSRGIHFAAASYLPNYANGGSRIVAVEISPTDVVAFPRDYNLAKGRACRLKVVGEVPLNDVPTFYPQGQKVYDGWTASTTLAKPAKPPFAVGQIWRNRNGDTIELVSTSSGIDGPEYPLEDKFGETYTPVGQVYVSEQVDGDLVEYVRG
jgi:hypothetical protein